MQQTEHYGLNQWELTDRIQMADFNADNLKIAAALAEKMGTWKLISKRPFCYSTGFIYPPAQEWKKYSMALLFFDSRFSQTDETGRIEWQLIAGQYSPSKYSKVFTSELGPAAFLFFPMRDSNNPVRGIYIGCGRCEIFIEEWPFSKLDMFTCQFKTSLRPDVNTGETYITLYGLQ